jgi:hypothetical protein
VHIAGRSAKISACDCARRLARIEIARVDALGCLLILGDVAIHALGEVLSFVRLSEEKPSQCLTDGNRLRRASREGIATLVSHYDDSFAVLRNKIVGRVQQLYVYNIAEMLKPLRNLI